MEELKEKLDTIFNAYEVKWLDFYDSNNSDISKRNNQTFYKSIFEELKIELITESIKHKIDNNLKESIVEEYFKKFNQYCPKHS